MTPVYAQQTLCVGGVAHGQCVYPPSYPTFTVTDEAKAHHDAAAANVVVPQTVYEVVVVSPHPPMIDSNAYLAVPQGIARRLRDDPWSYAANQQAWQFAWRACALGPPGLQPTMAVPIVTPSGAVALVH